MEIQKNTIPKVEYDKSSGILNIEGRATSPYVNEYLKGFLYNFKEDIEKNPKNLEVNIDLEYFNTRMSGILYKTLEVVKENIKNGYDTHINWKFEDDDEDMFETIKSYEFNLDIKINIVKKQYNDNE
jgi:hypothetical protein